ncbi:MAG: type III-B CRISPR module RAMP protein Cmr6, partial [Candidatus Baldrarchaeia archaeon]
LISSQRLTLDKALKTAHFFTDILFGSPSGTLQPPSHISVFCLTDAYPVSAGSGVSLVDPDVLTPHYSPVEKTFEEHRVTPTPIVFLTLPPGITMKFFVYPNYRISKKVSEIIKHPYSSSLSAMLEEIILSSGDTLAREMCEEYVKILKNIKSEESLEQLLKSIINNAVSIIGLGGKTSSGYGYFKVKRFKMGGERE